MKMKHRFQAILIFILACFSLSFCATLPVEFQKPPLGWNSYDYFETNVTEQQVWDNANFMVTNLKSMGYTYVVIDGGWQKPIGNASWKSAHPNWILNMDANGRQLPDAGKFPSSNGGTSLKNLADSLHKKGLKIGVHLMRGIPRQAVTDNVTILGTQYKAKDIANTKDSCWWGPDMWGVDMTKPGAQEYFNSIFKLYASWGLDLVKIDDLVRETVDHGNEYHGAELIGYRKAIDSCGRVIFLSTSPGPCNFLKRDEIVANANAFRMSDDMWDCWESLTYGSFKNDTLFTLKQHFPKWERWIPYIGAGHWCDNDMLPIGTLSKSWNSYGDPGRLSRLTNDEMYNLMTFTVITRSPVFLGGNCPTYNAFTKALVTNPKVTEVNQNSENNRYVYSGNFPVWCANIPGSTDKYLAVFNLTNTAATVTVTLKDIGATSPSHSITDVWTGTTVGQFTNSFASKINAHGAGLYLVVNQAPQAAPEGRLAGTPFGMGPTLVNNEYIRAFDGDTATFFNNYETAKGAFCGMDLGAGKASAVAKIRFFPRSGKEGRMVGGKFQGSNSEMWKDYSDLYVVTAAPKAGWNDVTVSSTTPYRFIRYIGADTSWGNVAEIEFYNTSTPVVGNTSSFKNRVLPVATYSLRAINGVVSLPKKYIDKNISVLVLNIAGKVLQKSTTSNAEISLNKSLSKNNGVLIVKAEQMK